MVSVSGRPGFEYRPDDILNEVFVIPLILSE